MNTQTLTLVERALRDSLRTLPHNLYSRALQVRMALAVKRATGHDVLLCVVRAAVEDRETYSGFTWVDVVEKVVGARKAKQ